jgi:hypothetical protein
MPERNADRALKTALVVGYVALLAGVIAARRAPATAYELSLYAATPTATWAGVAVAAVVGSVAALRGRGRIDDAGTLLVGGTALTVFALPLLRGYHFYGAGDSMSHLGWARELAAGTLEPVNLLYPAIHVVGVAVAELGDVPLTTGILVVSLLVFPLVFLAFVPLCVQLLAGSDRAAAVGLLAAALFVPINNISIHPIAHPASQAVLFLPFVLFVVMRYLTGTRRTEGGLASVASRVTPFGILLAVVSAAVVLVHPQQALNVVAVFATIAGMQALYRRYRSTHPIVDHRPLYAQTLLIAVLFGLWAPRFDTVSGTVTATLASVVGDASAGGVVAAKSQSLTAVGGDIIGLFVRLFLPGVVLSLLAAILLVGVVRVERAGDEPEAGGLLVYVAAALVPLLAAFALLAASSAGDMYFRYQGFIMVFVTLLAGVTLTKLLTASATSRFPLSRPSVSWLVAVLFVLLLPVAGMALHPSPYMYQPTPHVPATQTGGYAGAFDHRVPNQQFSGIRGGPRRFVDAAYGTERAETSLDFPGYEDRLPEPVFNTGNYTDYYDEDRYVAVTRANYEHEVRLYGEFRYAERGFERLDATPDVGRVRSNDGFGLYYVDAEE